MNFNVARLNIAVFFHSLYIISMQVILMRVLTIMQWDTIANLTISIAMLGFGVAGTLFSLFRQFFLKHSIWLISSLILLTSVFIHVSFVLSQTKWILFDSFLVFQSLNQMLKFLLFVLLYFIPFFLGSLVLGLIFATHINQIHRLYFVNLIGSGFGGLLALVVLNLMPPNQALIFLSFFPCLAIIVLKPLQMKKVISLATLLVFLITGLHLMFPTDINMSQYKSLSKTFLLPDARKVFEYNSFTSQITIVKSDYLHYSTSLSLNQSYSSPPMLFVFRNGNYVGVLPEHEQDISILDHSTLKLAYELTSPDVVGIMQSGTGFYAQYAVYQGVKRIFAIEPDLGLINAIKKWSEQSNIKLLYHPSIELVSTNPRFFLDSTQMQFDLIVLPPIGYQNVSATQSAITEEFDFTLEAFINYWKRLSDEGILYINSFFDNPPRSSLKVLSTISEMLQYFQISKIEKHVVALRNWNSVAFFVKKTKFENHHLSVIENFCNEKGFDILIYPQVQKFNRQRFHFLTDTTVFVLYDQVMQMQYDKSLSKYLYKILPTVDDKPYFSNYVSIGKLPQLLEKFTFRELFLIESSYFLIWLSFILLFICSFFFIFLPLFRFTKASGNAVIMLYFGSIGIAFMMFEILLIRRFVYYLGNEIYSTTAVLTLMLIFSGLGSYFSDWFSKLFKRWYDVFLIIVLCIFLVGFFYEKLLSSSISESVVLKILLMTLVIGIPSFFMGMPFPLGMKFCNEKFSNKIPWAWGINGFMSVCAIPLTTLFAIELGARWLFFLTAILYVFPFFILILFKKTQ